MREVAGEAQQQRGTLLGREVADALPDAVVEPAGRRGVAGRHIRDRADRDGAPGPRAVPDVPAPDAAASGRLDDGVWDRVGDLPPKQRAALLLRFAGDLSHREVAKAMGTSEEAARRSAHEGLKRLREELAA